jgi:hypothetical protein
MSAFGVEADIHQILAKLYCQLLALLSLAQNRLYRGAERG